MNTAVGNIESVQRSKEEAPRQAGKQRLMLGVKMAVSAALIYYLVSKADVAAIWTAVTSANMSLVILSFLLHGIGYFSSSYRWHLLLKDQGFEVPVSYLMRSYAIAMFFNNLLPSTIGGDGYRAFDTTKQGVPKTQSLAIVLVERFLGLFALMMFALLAFSMAAGIVTRTENLWIWVVCIFSAMTFGVWLIFFRGSSGSLPGFITRLPGGSILTKLISKIQDAFAPFRGRTKVLTMTMLISLLFQLNVIFHYYLISEALGLDVGFNYYLVFIPLSIFIQTLPVSINGIGVREGIYVSFLTEMLGKATVAQSLAFSWIAYGMILLLGILGGVMYAFRKDS